MTKLVKSAWWIIYYYDEFWEPRFLLIKRHAVSGKVERVAPKWKLQDGENYEKAALREVSEETGIPINLLSVVQNVWMAKIFWLEDRNWKYDKEVTYFLMKYDWSPDLVDIKQVEWYLWVYKWATISEVLNLIYYSDIRELFRKWYNSLRDKKKKNDVKKDFMNLL